MWIMNSMQCFHSENLRWCNIYTVLQLTLRNLFRMDEFLQYTPHPDDPSKWESSCQSIGPFCTMNFMFDLNPVSCSHRTLLRQTASMSVFGIPLLGDLLESLLINSYSSVVSKVRRIAQLTAISTAFDQVPHLLGEASSWVQGTNAWRLFHSITMYLTLHPVVLTATCYGCLLHKLICLVN